MQSIKSYAMQAALAATLAGASVCATATTITFDDLKPDFQGSVIQNGYAGLNWNNFYVVNGHDYGGGYIPGTVSQPNIAYNGFGKPASFGSTTAFSLQSLYITKAWQDGLTHIDGYSGSTLLYSSDVFSTTTSATFVTLNWTNLNRVVISDADGSHHSAIDNIVINSVPEPETYAMMLAGLGLVGAIARRRKLA